MIRRIFLLALVVPVLAACGRTVAGTDPGDDQEPDPPGPPLVAKIERVSGNGQRAPARTELPEPFVVRLTDKDAKPIPGIGVRWYAVYWICGYGSGRWYSGSFNPDSVVTDANGLAETRYTLDGPGPYHIGVTIRSEHVEPDFKYGTGFGVCSEPIESFSCHNPGPNGPLPPC